MYIHIHIYIYIYIYSNSGAEGRTYTAKGGTMLRGHIAPKCTQMQLKEITSQQAAEHILKPLAAPRCCPHISPEPSDPRPQDKHYFENQLC